MLDQLQESREDGNSRYEAKVIKQLDDHGDRCSAFFHNIMREKKNRNRIVIVKDNIGTKFIGQQQIANGFINHFHNLLGKEDNTNIS